MDYYNGLLLDVQRTIANMNDNGESKFSNAELPALASSTNGSGMSKFSKHFRNISAVEENEFELPALKRKGSKI